MGAQAKRRKNREASKSQSRELATPARALPAWPLACVLFLVLLGVYHVNSGVELSSDATPNLYLPVSILTEGDLSFTPKEAPEMFLWNLDTPEGTKQVRIRTWNGTIAGRQRSELFDAGLLTVKEPMYYLLPSVVEGRYVSTFGIGAGLTALPPFTVLQLLTNRLAKDPALLGLAGKFVASALVAGSAVFIFLIAAHFTKQRYALLLAVAYGLGTCVWSVSSQALWQHGPNEFYLAAAAYCLLRIRDSRKAAVACGMALGMAVLSRPDSAQVVVAIAAYLAITDRKALLRVAVGGLPFALALAIYNWHYLDSPVVFGQTAAGAKIATYKTGSPDLWQTPLAAGLAGILVSPSRGLFVYSSFLLFALWGAIAAWRDRRWATLRPLSVAVLAVWCLQAKHFDWWSGWSFGYRHIVDTAPFMVMLLIPIVERLVRTRGALGIFAALLSISVVVQFLGAMTYHLFGWNDRTADVLSVPGREDQLIVLDKDESERMVKTQGASVVKKTHLNIDKPENRHRLWSWTDSQILYHLTHYAESRKARLEMYEKWRRQP